ncbi:MAG: enolase C-terminal domain-like protein [Phycisphaerae bacterium]
MRQSQIACVRVFPLSIPLRHAFSHAANSRVHADPVLVQIELGGGTIGYGETLPRPYVTRENVESVVAAIRGPLAAELLTFRPSTFAEALERIDALPFLDDQGRLICAARAAVELALLDVYSRFFNRDIAEAAGWLGLPGLGNPGSAHRVRYSGVLSGDSIVRLRRSVRKMRLFGLRDFKLKVGYEDDVDRVSAVVNALRRALRNGATLRLDANGAWSIERALEMCRVLRSYPIACIEQPLPPGCEEQLIRLKSEARSPIMHDESLVTQADAERLYRMGIADAFNIRLSKNGGFLPSLRLAYWAGKRGIRHQLGCMVGETSVLSAAGRKYLECAPGVWFAEGSYGRFLLRGDVVKTSIRFGYGGRFRTLSGRGWGIEVDQALLRRHTAGVVAEMFL